MQKAGISGHVEPGQSEISALMEGINVDTSGKEPAKEKRSLKPQSVTDQREHTLAEQIEHLWSIERDKKFFLKRTRHERANNRAELAKHLSELKSLLCGRGRDGAWLPYLRKIGIPRSTAESLINAKEKATHTLPVLTKESIGKLVKTLKPKLLLLNSRELADQFVHEVVILLDEQIAQQAGLVCGSVGSENQGPQNLSHMQDQEQAIMAALD